MATVRQIPKSEYYSGQGQIIIADSVSKYLEPVVRGEGD